MGGMSAEVVDDLRKAREEFLSQGIRPAGLVSDTIFRSWQRSAERGIGRDGKAPRCIPPSELAHRRDQSNTLLLRSQPVMENLYQEISGTSSMVLLADSAGVILHSIGDPVFVGQAQKVALKPGGVWSEGVTGTNAIGTALEEQLPVQVQSSEHFFDQHRFLSCSAAPIFDPRGAILGALDVSGDFRGHQPHTLALVRMSAQIIENQMFAAEFPDDIVLSFHLKLEFIGTLYEGIAVFSPQGDFIAANRSALQQFGRDRFRISGETFSSLFRLSLAKLLEQARFQHQPILKLQLQSGAELYGRVRPGLSPAQIPILPLITAPARDIKSCPIGTPPPILLHELESGDRTMQALLAKARKVIDHDITIMIQGETGTGKELLALALHQAGPRSNGPFVPINCASIPEGLIESELFGYQEGAFTGANRKGHVGKIREAHGGTLFLDEIGEMPLLLQARLLRVLQDRRVTPLGGTGSHQVDLAVICATNRLVREIVAAGKFREDLYYRLNGLLLTLPGLRQRDDKLPLARKILAGLNRTDSEITLHPDVLRIFEHHPWPGNIRQMHNLLRTAVALLGERKEILIDDLVEDFLAQADLAADSETDTEIDCGGTSLVDLEARHIAATLDRTGGNVSAAARQLGMGRTTLYRKLRSLPSPDGPSAAPGC